VHYCVDAGGGVFCGIGTGKVRRIGAGACVGGIGRAIGGGTTAG
jgi:hypothetical protein